MMTCVSARAILILYDRHVCFVCVCVCVCVIQLVLRADVSYAHTLSHTPDRGQLSPSPWAYTPKTRRTVSKGRVGGGEEQRK